MNTGETRYWESVATEWRAAHPDPLWRTHGDAVNWRLLDRWLPEKPVGRLLKTDLFDEAVSPGLYPLLATRARVVVGMDLSGITVRVARLRYPALMAAGADARQLPFADGSFDIIVSDSTLDHFHTEAELIASLRELHRVLRPDGELLLTLDNRANPVIALRNALPFHWLHRVGLVPYYVGATCGPRGLRRLAAHAGWEIGEMAAILHCPRVLAVKVARLIQSPAAQQRFLRWLLGFEQLACWPTRYLTGYFVAARLVRKGGG